MKRNAANACLIAVCIGLITSARASQSNVHRRQMEVGLQAVLENGKSFNTTTFYNFVTTRFIRVNSSTEEKIKHLTELLDTLSHLNVTRTQENFAVKLSSQICSAMKKIDNRQRGKTSV
jgi:hypothetical protein